VDFNDLLSTVVVLVSIMVYVRHPLAVILDWNVYLRHLAWAFRLLPNDVIMPVEMGFV
jgi:hypothetical protein